MLPHMWRCVWWSCMQAPEWIISEFRCSSVSKRVQGRNHFYENKFDLHENEPVGGTRFHLKGFARRLFLAQRRKVTCIWPAVADLLKSALTGRISRTENFDSKHYDPKNFVEILCNVFVCLTSPTLQKSPFYSCVLSYLATNASEVGGDLALIQTSLLFSCKCQLVSIRTTWFAQ